MFTITGENYESQIYADCRCKSTDEKRTDVPTNTMCLEMDTGNVYYFDSDKTWKPFGGGQ